MAQFLSDAWFDEVDKIKADAGEIEVPDVLKAIVLNVVITEHPEGDKEVSMVEGGFARGHQDNAGAKLTLPYGVAKAMFVDRDDQAGMQAFMSGQLQVEGDMSLLMQMQSAGPPTDSQKAFAKKVAEITEA